MLSRMEPRLFAEYNRCIDQLQIIEFCFDSLKKVQKDAISDIQDYLRVIRNEAEKNLSEKYIQIYLKRLETWTLVLKTLRPPFSPEKKEESSPATPTEFRA